MQLSLFKDLFGCTHDLYFMYHGLTPYNFHLELCEICLNTNEHQNKICLSVYIVLYVYCRKSKNKII